MVRHIDINNQDVRKLIRHKEIKLGGNRNLKIYGLLRCKSGKRMKRENRVFFTDLGEATDSGYRPCGNCLRSEYKEWKNGSV
ncbi:Ada metal-binding domain-containing protein [Mucilaginibacter sp. OK098]|uniref:Ada metal-binding domain-containing protein n=1 Tax=Mucilaginibacter sp. OK098 TaxID=1855297 RepID=UPI0009247DBF|nr:Ada metal-binding domain-containing protein [Mucilaginibacter sp. OK098]SHN36751.1 Metal binding domain of Ada [Mucilaginibacter sp. OK098]